MKSRSAIVMRKAGEGVVRDPEIRAALLKELRRRRVLRGKTVVVQELGLRRSDAVVDVAVVNGSLNGFEIKSDADTLLPQAEEARAGSEAAARKERMKQRTPRVDWAELLKRTFDFDVFACVRCGGRRRVLAYVKAGRGVRAILEHLGLPTAGVSLAPAQELTQAAWC